MSVLRRLLGVNVMGCGIFMCFGIAARRGAWGALAGDPVPHALIITGVVVAFAATALGLALLRREAELASAPDAVAEGAAGPSPLPGETVPSPRGERP